jgi:outer membrane immunogenic protein
VGEFGFTNSFAFTDSNTAPLSSPVFGAQVGYNHQFSPRWVLGFEADFQDSNQRGGNIFTDSFASQICVLITIPAGTCGGTLPVNGTAVTAYQAKIEWLDTVRLRLGYLITDQILLYGTGGPAYGRVQLSANSNVSGAINDSGFLTPLTAGGTASSVARTNVGLAVGGGMEAKLPPWLPANWTAKVEYLYVDLGSLDATTSLGGAFPFFEGPVPLSATLALHTHFIDNIVRVGINYQFGN